MMRGKRLVVAGLVASSWVGGAWSAEARPITDMVGASEDTVVDNRRSVEEGRLIGDNLVCQFLPLIAKGAPQAVLPQGISAKARDIAGAFAACERLSGESAPFSVTVRITFQYFDGTSFINVPNPPYPPGVCVANAHLGQVAEDVCSHQVLYDIDDPTLNTVHRARFEFFTDQAGEPKVSLYSAPWFQGRPDLPEVE